MKDRLFFLLRLSVFFIVYFIVSRIYFQLYLCEQTAKLSISEIFLTYIHGTRLDLSVTGYILLFTSIITLFTVFIPGKWYYYLINFLVITFLFTFSLIVVADAELYQHWGFRMDTTPLMYLKDPDLAMASTPVALALLLILVWLIFSSLFTWIYLRIIAVKAKNLKPLKWYYSPVFLVLASFMILPIRGSLGIAPINTGTVYFSKNLYANHATLNVIWNMLYDVANSNRTNFEANYFTDEKAKEIYESCINHNHQSDSVISNPKPNILIIVLESFSAKVVEPLGGRAGITPNFNKLWNDGLAFDHLYATGLRSDRGLVAILSGYPSHPRASVMKYPQKTQNIPSLCSVLNRQGYQSAYYYGGDTDFANMKSYLLNSGFQRIINQDQFPKELRNSKWGVHDEYMFQYLLNDIDSAKQPYFKVMFTLSSHEPFDVPMETVIKGNTTESKYLNSVYYSDKCLGKFIAEFKTRECWNNTLIILVADHSVKYVDNPEINDPVRYHIPMLWTGGALTTKGVINKPCCQYDIPATLLNQMDLPYDNFTFSSNILNNDQDHYGMFIYNQGFGLISGKGSVVYNFDQEKFVRTEGDTTNLTNASKGLFQFMINHFNHL